MRCLLLCSFALVFAVGCASKPSLSQAESADYGAPIAQQDAEHKAEQWLEARLKDPESAKYDWQDVQRGWMSRGFGSFDFGYMLIGGVNAKNSFGGYVGERVYQFLFYNGDITGVNGERRSSYGTPYMTRIH